MKRIGLIASILALVAGGCSAPTIGNTAKYGDTSLSNPSPVTLHIEDANKQGTASGTGPASYEAVTKDRIEQMQTGVPTRKFLVEKNADGSIRVSGSSGTDVLGKGIAYNPKTGAFTIDEISTVTSEPLRAHNEAYPPLVEYWAARDEKSKEAILRIIDAVDKGLGAVFRAAAGIP